MQVCTVCAGSDGALIETISDYYTYYTSFANQPEEDPPYNYISLVSYTIITTAKNLNSLHFL